MGLVIVLGWVYNNYMSKDMPSNFVLKKFKNLKTPII